MENFLQDLSVLLYCFVSLTSLIIASFLALKRPLSSSVTAKNRLTMIVGEKSVKSIAADRLFEMIKDDRNGNTIEKGRAYLVTYVSRRNQMAKVLDFLKHKMLKDLVQSSNDIEVSIAVNSANAAKERLVSMVRKFNRKYEGRNDLNENDIF